jgi:Family of unknown function (DUF5678)
MTVTLPPELESRVAEKARAEGISAEAYVERLVRESTGNRRECEASKPLGQKRASEIAWRQTHPEMFRQHEGNWVALEGERIVAHGADLVRVVAEAREKGIKPPYVFRVECLDSEVVTMGL